MSTSVGVSLLGPLEIRNASGSSDVHGAQLHTLLALLALAVPHAVSDDKLIEELWGEARLSNAANALQAQVTQLRRLLGRDAVARVTSSRSIPTTWTSSGWND